MSPWGSSPEQTTCYANTVCALSDESMNLESWTTECQNQKTKSQLPSMYTKTGSLMATQSLPTGPPSSYKTLARSREQIEVRHVHFHLQKISANLGFVFSPLPSEEEETESIVQGQSFWQAGSTRGQTPSFPQPGFRLRHAHQSGQNCSGWLLLAASPIHHPSIRSPSDAMLIGSASTSEPDLLAPWKPLGQAASRPVLSWLGRAWTSLLSPSS